MLIGPGFAVKILQCNKVFYWVLMVVLSFTLAGCQGNGEAQIASTAKIDSPTKVIEELTLTPSATVIIENTATASFTPTPEFTATLEPTPTPKPPP